MVGGTALSITREEGEKRDTSVRFLKKLEKRELTDAREDLKTTNGPDISRTVCGRIVVQER